MKSYDLRHSPGQCGCAWLFLAKGTPVAEAPRQEVVYDFRLFKDKNRRRYLVAGGSVRYRPGCKHNCPSPVSLSTVSAVPTVSPISEWPGQARSRSRP